MADPAGNRAAVAIVVLTVAVLALPVLLVLTVDREDDSPLLPSPAPPSGPLLDSEALAAEIEAALERREGVPLTVSCASVVQQPGLVSPCTAFAIDPLTSTPRVRQIRVTQGRRGTTEWQVVG